MIYTLDKLNAMPARELDCIVAGLAGWTKIGPKGFGFKDMVGCSPKEPAWPFTHIPKFSESLDAMHEAEKVLPEDRKANYADRIWSEIPLLDLGEHIENEDRFAGDMYGFLTATARQRAIAFVLTMQK